MATKDELTELQRQLDELRVEQAFLRSTQGAISTSIRKSRLALAVAEHDEGLRRLRPDTALLGWHPRQGTPTDPELDTSLLARLRRADPVADSLGNAEALLGPTNLLANPELAWDSSIALGTAPTLISGNDGTLAYAWRGYYTNGPGATVIQLYARGDASDPFTSSIQSISGSCPAFGADDIYVYQDVDPTGAWIWPFLIASCRVGGDKATTATKLEFYMEIVNVTDGVVATSAALNAKTFDAQDNPQRLSASFLRGAYAWSAKSWRWRLRIHSEAGAGGATFSVSFGDPMLHFSDVAAPAPYSPAVARWLPDQIASYGLAGDNYRRFLLDGRSGGIATWGPGTAARDLRLRRATTKALELDDNAGGPGRLWIKGDVVGTLGATFDITYNGDGTVASVARSGAQGVATTAVTYTGGKVSSVQTVRGGKTVTITPTWTGDQVTQLVRAVA